MKNRYDLELPDLTPDLEWMLSSGQVSSMLLLEKLLQDHYPKIFQFAFSFLDDRALAERCAQGIFVRAMLTVHKFSSGTGVETWLYQIAWQQCQKASRHQKARQMLINLLPTVAKHRAAEYQSPVSSQEARLWRAVDGLGEFPRSVLLLHALFSWSAEKLATVVGASVEKIEAVLMEVGQEFSDSGWNNGGEETELSAALFRLFSARWPAPAAGELEELAAGISRQVAGKQSRIKPVATILEVSLLAGVVLAAGIFLVWARSGEGAPRSSPVRQVAAAPSATPAPTQRHPPANSALLAPRKYLRTPVPTPTPTPEGVLYDSVEGEDLAQIAARLDVALDDLRRLNRIAEHESIAHGQILYIPDSLPEFTTRYVTPVPPVTYTLSLETPAGSEDITRLLHAQDRKYETVWLDAVLFMSRQLPFSEEQDLLRIQIWLSGNQALLLGGRLGEDPEEVLLQNDEQVFISLPGRGNPWFQPFEMPAGESLIDMRLIFGVISLLESGSQIDNPNYKYNGEDRIAGRPGWKISELDQQMTQVKEITIDQETGFILRSIRNPEYPDDREEIAYFPQEVTVTAIEFNVDFPQHLFNHRLPWRGGYAWDHSGEPYRVLNIP